MNIRVYSDGSATTAIKPGGYGWVLVVDGVKHSEGSGYVPLATNNDMEMEAAIQGLAAVLKTIKQNSPHTSPEFHEVTLVSDSQLILGWASGRYRFKQADKIHKYEQLKALVTRLKAQTEWVRGHSGDEYNERCDKLANAARLQVVAEQEQKDAQNKGETCIGTKKIGIVCVWYENKLKVIDLNSNIVENYDREIHGQRGSMLEVRSEKNR